MSEPAFRIAAPTFTDGRATLRYALGELAFTETLDYPAGWDDAAPRSASFERLLELAALVLGTSYFKLCAPTRIFLDFPLSDAGRAFALDVYENGMGEFYARNQLRRFGKIEIEAPEETRAPGIVTLRHRALLPIGGGKDSLVSVSLLEAAGTDFTPFAVNPRGPILTSIERIGRPPIYVTRKLDPEMIQLSTEPGYYTGHVPSTAINSMIAALAALLFGYDRIVLSNERSASEGNMHWGGREVNHQHSKSLAFEERMADVLSGATGGALQYFSLLRPFSEARIARLFAQTPRFDDVFSSCNRNFRYNGHDGPLWCGECPKCHFVFLILAPAMDKDRLVGIFGKNLLAVPGNEASFRALTGLAGQKPWECVGEILEAAASLYELTQRPEWAGAPVVAALRDDLLRQYGAARLDEALAELMADSAEHHIPKDIAERVALNAP